MPRYRATFRIQYINSPNSAHSLSDHTTHNSFFLSLCTHPHLHRSLIPLSEYQLRKPRKMPTAKESSVSHRVWKLLRLILSWARQGRAFKLQLRLLVPKFLKTIGQATPRRQIWYRERELSFDKTPVVHVKMHRPGPMRFPLPHIPCINPHVDFDREFDEDDRLCYGYEAVRQSFLENGGEEGTHFDEEQEEDGRVEIEEDRGIDARAEEFIAKFYEQTKLQRQISYLQYNEMLNQSAS